MPWKLKPEMVPHLLDQIAMASRIQVSAIFTTLFSYIHFFMCCRVMYSGASFLILQLVAGHVWTRFSNICIVCTFYTVLMILLAGIQKLMHYGETFTTGDSIELLIVSLCSTTRFSIINSQFNFLRKSSAQLNYFAYCKCNFVVKVVGFSGDVKDIHILRDFLNCGEFSMIMKCNQLSRIRALITLMTCAMIIDYGVRLRIFF